MRVSAQEQPAAIWAIALTVVALLLAVLSWMSASDRWAAKSTHPENVYFGGAAAARAAYAQLAANNPQAALAPALRAVRTAPIDPASTSALGSALLALGRADQAFSAFAVAGGLGWRNVSTQLYWLAQAEAMGDVDVLAQRLDALLRLDIDNEAVQNSLHALAQSAVGQQALAMLLTKNPPWSERFIRGTGALQDADLAGRAAAITRAIEKGATIDCSALGEASTHLILQGDVAIARDLWRQTCDRKGNGLIFNGTFEQDPTIASKSPFTWQLRSEAGLDMAALPGPKPLNGNALRITSSRTVRTIVAQQIMALEPGRYRLSWTTALENGQPDASITVLVQCEGSPDAISGASTQAANSAVATVVVPAQGCPIQRVGIQKAASDPMESKTGWVDDIRIVPLSAATADAS